MKDGMRQLDTWVKRRKSRKGGGEEKWKFNAVEKKKNPDGNGDAIIKIKFNISQCFLAQHTCSCLFIMQQFDLSIVLLT